MKPLNQAAVQVNAESLALGKTTVRSSILKCLDISWPLQDSVFRAVPHPITKIIHIP